MDDVDSAEVAAEVEGGVEVEVEADDMEVEWKL